MKNRSDTVKRSSPRFRFFGDTIGELKKVVWLTRQETLYLTALVLIVTIAVGLSLGVIDYGFSTLVNDLFLPGR